MQRYVLVVLALALMPGLIYSYSSISQQNYTPAYANALVANVSNYVELVNQSSYLVFHPDLSGAYFNLTLAQGNITSNPSASVLYAQKANKSAYNQYLELQYSKGTALPVIVAFTLAMLIVLYKVMVPVKKSQRKR